MPDPFPTTRWSVVLAARERDTTRAREAMEALCRAYWFPLYAYVRRKDHDAETARDLTQAFFMRLVEARYLDIVKPEAGRFRAFLLHKFKQFLGHERDRARAKKRGGGIADIRFDLDEAEARYLTALADPRTPEKEYERRWAQTVVDRALERLAEDARQRGRIREFGLLKGYVTGNSARTSYQDVATEIGVGVSAVKSAVHRLRKRLGRVMREEIAETVADPAEVDDEMRHLFAALE